MAFKPWSVAIAWLVTFGLFGLAGFGVVAGIPLVLLIGAALATPALLVRDSAEATSGESAEPGQVPRVNGAIPAHAAAY